MTVPRLSTREAFERLRRGNRRFASGRGGKRARRDPARRRELASGQSPVAIVLGCSDSRVPPEIVFDQGLGDLFVVRLAGNLVSPAVIATVEAAVDWFATRLVVVLGHTACGAVTAALELAIRGEDPSPTQRPLVEALRPTIAPLLRTDLRDDPEALLHHAIRANVLRSVRVLRESSDLLAHLERRSDLSLQPAEYSLDTGQVDFFAEEEKKRQAPHFQ